MASPMISSLNGKRLPRKEPGTSYKDQKDPEHLQEKNIILRSGGEGPLYLYKKKKTD